MKDARPQRKVRNKIMQPAYCDLYSRATAARDYVRALTPLVPRVGIILGSGLGAFASVVTGAVTIPYATIPHFPQSTVEGTLR